MLKFPEDEQLPAWGCGLRAGCKFMDAGGNGWISDAIRCWDYCTRQDAHLVSNSWGVYSTSAALQQAAAALNARGVLLMASAGNSARVRPHPILRIPFPPSHHPPTHSATTTTTTTTHASPSS